MNIKVIVLRTISYRDSDLIVQCLSKSGSKIGFLARGALKSRKRFGGGLLEPTHYLDVIAEDTRRQVEQDSLQILAEAQLINGFSGIREDYDSLQLGFHFLKLISQVSLDGTEHPENFNFLGNALTALETLSNWPKVKRSEGLQRLKLHFELKLLAQQGVLPGLAGAESWLEASILDFADLQILPEELKTMAPQVHYYLGEYLGQHNF